MTIFSKLFVMDAAERAIATFAQTVVALIAVLAPMQGTDLLTVNYLPVLLVGLLAAILSVLKSVVASFTGDKNSASLVK